MHRTSPRPKSGQFWPPGFPTPEPLRMRQLCVSSTAAPSWTLMSFSEPKALDDLSDAPSDGAITLNHMRSARSAAALIQLRPRLSRRVTTDDDDDPPPRPAAAMPIPVSLLAA